MYNQRSFQVPSSLRRAPQAASKNYSQLFGELPLRPFLSVIGAIFFVGGSIYQIPAKTSSDETACFLFILGSLFYLGAWGQEAKFELDSTGFGFNCLFTLAPAFLIISSIFNRPSVRLYSEALVLAFLGCGLFGVRGLYRCFKALKAITKQRESLQPVVLESAVALNYALGSTLFLVADSLHLLKWKSKHDKQLMYKVTGIMCVLGSFFFLGAGLFECGRAFLSQKKGYRRDYRQDSLLMYDRGV